MLREFLWDNFEKLQRLNSINFLTHFPSNFFPPSFEEETMTVIMLDRTWWKYRNQTNDKSS